MSPIVENVIILEYCKTGEHMKVRFKKKWTLPEWKVILTYRHTHTQRRRGVNKKKSSKNRTLTQTKTIQKSKERKKYCFKILCDWNQLSLDVIDLLSN